MMHLNNIPIQIDTLIIIGNGFDIWQGIQTSYSDFEKYYHEHLGQILKALHMKPVLVQSPDKPDRWVSAVEMLYGDPFEARDLDSDFWNTFEASLDKIDTERVNLYYGKSRSNLRDLHRNARDAIRILKRAFAEWITSKEIGEGDSGFFFPENCMVINFNYTDTVEKRFGVRPERDYHIHGEASDPESIIVGHASHPEYPFAQLKRIGGRFEGLYYIEEVLYETDKHVDDNFRMMAGALAMRGVAISDIKKVFVLGHSLGDADFGYFRHLASALNEETEDPFAGTAEWVKEYLQSVDIGSMDFDYLNMQYAIHRGVRSMGKSIMEYPDLLDIRDYDEGNAEMGPEEGEDEPGATTARPEEVEDGPGAANGAPDVSADDAELEENPYYRMPAEDKLSLEAAAVHLRYLMEQAERDDYADKLFEKAMMKGMSRKDRKRLKRQMWEAEKLSAGADTDNEAADSREDGHSGGCDNLNQTVDSANIRARAVTQPEWHITFYSENDRKKIIEVMERIGVTNYRLFPAIDECIEEFRGKAGMASSTAK